MCACVSWLIIQYAVFKCKPWRPDPQLLSGSVAGGVSVELTYKEVTREVTTGMESIIHIKLLCQVLPWLHQVSPFLAHSRHCWSPVPASSVPALASPALPEGTCSWDHLQSTWGAQSAEAAPRQVPNYSSSCSQRPSGQWGKGLFTARGEGKDKESYRKGFKTLGPMRKM